MCREENAYDTGIYVTGMMMTQKGHMPPDPVAPSYVCARCAAQYPTCCRMSHAALDQCFPLSDNETQRIAEEKSLLRKLGDAYGAHIHGREQEEPGTRQYFFRESTVNSFTFRESMHQIFPDRPAVVDAAYPAEGRHHRLAIQRNGDCVFLGPAGCLLPGPARPHFCRIFPFWIISGRMQCFAPDDCLAVQESPNVPRLLSLFGLHERDLFTRFERLTVDWGLDVPSTPAVP